ncbi:MAG: hypothetical protein SPJ99_08490 [Candidatus Coprenecus sp.]|nr:hypothetical protein [Candidatus Coprenecus sp.]
MEDFCLSPKWEMVVKYEIEYIKMSTSWSRWEATYIREDSYLN